MIRLTLTAFLIATPATADVELREVHGENHVAEVVLINRVGANGGIVERHEIVIPEGMIVVTEYHTPNARCVPACPDRIVIDALPPGIVAEVPELTVPEQKTGVIRLFRFAGS